MDRCFSHTSKSSNRCYQCENGRLQNEVYFYHFDIIAREFCSCERGKLAFSNWLKTPEAKRGYQRKQEAKIKKALEVSQIPMRWQDGKIADIKNECIRQKLQRYLNDFTKHVRQGIGVYIAGASDIERTELLSMLCLEIIGRYSQPCIFLNENQIFSKIQSSFNNSENNSGKFIAELQSVTCLFIDGFANKIKPWHCEQLYHIISFRFNNSLPTFFSSFYEIKKYKETASPQNRQVPKEQQALACLMDDINSFEININQ